MAVGDSFTQLKKKALDLRRGERGGIRPLSMRVDELLEIGVEILKDEIEEGFAVMVDVLNAYELDDVDGVGEHLEEGDLAEGGGWNTFLVHLQTGFLEGDELAGLLVFGFVDFSIGTFAYLLQFLVLVFHGGLRMKVGLTV